jgi:hypothetical protein
MSTMSSSDFEDDLFDDFVRERLKAPRLSPQIEEQNQSKLIDSQMMLPSSQKESMLQIKTIELVKPKNTPQVFDLSIYEQLRVAGLEMATSPECIPAPRQKETIDEHKMKRFSELTRIACDSRYWQQKKGPKKH